MRLRTSSLRAMGPSTPSSNNAAISHRMAARACPSMTELRPMKPTITPLAVRTCTAHAARMFRSLYSVATESAGFTGDLIPLSPANQPVRVHTSCPKSTDDGRSLHR